MPARGAKTKSAEGGTIPEDKAQLVSRLVKENATIPDAKIYNYSLDKNHSHGGPKAVNFDNVLGYNTSNAEEFRSAILNGLKESQKKYVRTNDLGEDIFEAVMFIQGPTGRTARVVSSWKNTPGQRSRFSYVTAMIKGSKKKRDGDGRDNS
jgi:hypothetical protein